MPKGNPLASFRPVPMTGVIYVTTEAQKQGFTLGDSAWANLGQGAPEVALPEKGAEETPMIRDSKKTREYGPVAGIQPLRAAVANLYNELYRKGKSSLYTAENVSIASGGRLSLTRIAAAFGNIRIGHFIPDYTAYEELLTTFRSFTPIPILLQENKGYTFDAEKLGRRIQGLGLGALLASNPSNPTGRVTTPDELSGWVRAARAENCALILDEFYSQYLYNPEDQKDGISGARFVEDVDRDPVIIVDGLTKNLRRPGWRVSWTVAPKEVIRVIESVGSFLDGGAPHPLEDAAVPLLNPKAFREEARATRELFQKKREYTLARLKELGLEVPVPPAGTFYAWVKLSNMPKVIRDGLSFFNEALKEKVIVVPGAFFDINPGKHRKSATYNEYVRVSFGPPQKELERGFDGIARMIKKFS